MTSRCRSLAGYFKELVAAEDVIEGLTHKVQYLIDQMKLEEGTFTFPDGDTWEQSK